MTTRQFVAGFMGATVAIQCESEWLAAEVSARLEHLLRDVEPDTAGLRIRLNEPASSCAEAHGSTGQAVRGSIEYVLYHVRKWITAEFASSDPELLWLHAAAAASDGSAIVFAGPAGSGKSTLATQLIQRGARLISDDATPIRPGRLTVLPLPFSPEVRTPIEPAQPGPLAILQQPKRLTRVSTLEVASNETPIRAIVFPRYVTPGTEQPGLSRLSFALATRELALSRLYRQAHVRTMRDAVRLAQQIPCYRLCYGDAAAAAGQLAS